MESLKKTSFSEIDATIEVLGSYGVTSEGLKAVRKNSDLAAKVAALIMASIRTIFKITVNYAMSLSEMIKACNCGYNNPDINSQNFKIAGSGQQVVALALVAGREVLTWLIAHGQAAADQDWVTTKQVLDYMVSHGLVEAEVEHLLFFGAANPDIQREFPITALGSSFVFGDRHRYGPYLGCADDERRLGLYWYDDDSHWGGGWRFLAVCK